MDYGMTHNIARPRVFGTIRQLLPLLLLLIDGDMFRMLRAGYILIIQQWHVMKP